MVDHRNDAEFLERLAATRRAVDDFVDLQQNTTVGLRKKFDQEILDCRAKLESLRADETSFQNQNMIDSKALELKKQSLNDLREKLQSLKEKHATIPSKLTHQADLRKQLQETLAQEQKVVEDTEAITKETIDELHVGLNLYRKLGMEFNRLDVNKLQIAFRYIDPKDPNREFQITLKMNEDDDEYTVDSISPVVPRINDLILDLNSTNEFPRFVQTLRRKFQAIVV